MNLPESKFVRNSLKPISILYGLGASIKLGLYERNFLTATELSVPVISIGNITVGGTGKTPLTIDLANRFIKDHHKVGILSRGYKRRSTNPFDIVSDGNTIISSPLQAGDEPYLMALSCPQAVVISGQSRIDTGRLAIEKFGCTIILLDDGYQHVKLKRNRNILLFDYNDDLNKELVLPSGRLREPLSGLARATDVVITKIPPVVDELHLGKIKKLIGEYASLDNTRIYLSRFKPNHLRSEFERLELSNLQGAKVVSLSGIARPDSFHKTLLENGFTISKKLDYDDHHWFTEQDEKKIEQALTETDSNFVITTEKDLVRLNLKEDLARRTFALVQSTEWLKEVPLFDELTFQKQTK